MNTYINLIPLDHRRRNLFRRRLRQWSLVWLLCLIVVGTIGYRKVHRYRLDRQAARQATERYRPLKLLIDETRTMRQTLRELRNKGTLVAQLQQERPVIALLDLASRSAARCDGHLHLTRLEYEHEQRQEEAATAAAGKTPRHGPAPQPDRTAGPRVTPAQVRFAGEALDNLAIAAFAAALRDSRMFRRVELMSSVEGGNDATRRRSFQLTGEI